MGHQGTLYGKNACGVLLANVRSALLWDAARGNYSDEFADCRQEELVELAREAEDLYLAGLGHVREAEAGVATYGQVSDFDRPMPNRSDLHALGLREDCRYREMQHGVSARSLAPVEEARRVVYFRSTARLPWALLSNFAYVPWGA